MQLATISDLPALKHLLVVANNYAVKMSGLPSWVAIDRAHNDIAKHLDAKEVFVVRAIDGTPASTITLSENTEDWGDAGHDGRALYFTKFMKDPISAEPNDPKLLLSFAKTRARQSNKTVLRCDTVIDQAGILNYYFGLGFQEKGRFIYDSSNREGILLEAQLNDLALHNKN